MSTMHQLMYTDLLLIAFSGELLLPRQLESAEVT